MDFDWTAQLRLGFYCNGRSDRKQKEHVMARKNSVETKEILVDLIKAAAKSGGDRYAGMVGDQEWTVYIPQSISRQEGAPKKKLTINIS